MGVCVFSEQLYGEHHSSTAHIKSPAIPPFDVVLRCDDFCILTVFLQEGCVAPNVQHVLPHAKQPGSSGNHHLVSLDR